MTLARLTTAREVEYEIVNLTEDAEFVLRDDHGDVRLFEPHSLLERVEIRCDFCGRWSTHPAPVSGIDGPWMCYGGIGACDDD
jgi:hypothetical protein